MMIRTVHQKIIPEGVEHEVYTMVNLGVYFRGRELFARVPDHFTSDEEAALQDAAQRWFIGLLRG